MAKLAITATFTRLDSARTAGQLLAATGVASDAIEVEPVGQPAQREGRFLARFVLIVVLWSVAGTAVGAALGALLSYTVGPHGTDGLILQMISFAVFAHVLIGMWAGYVLLADRTEREVLPQRGQLTAAIDSGLASRVTDVLHGAGGDRSSGPPRRSLDRQRPRGLERGRNGEQV